MSTPALPLSGPVPLYVINLARSIDRLAHVSAQLNSQGLSFTRVNAVDGAAMSDVEYHAFIEQRPRPGGLTWRRGQMGCFLSHVDVWNRIAGQTSPVAMVLEDDIRVSRHLAAFVKSSDWFSSSADIIRIETTGQWLKLADRQSVGHGRSVARVRSSAWATGGYAITRAAAQRLLSTDRSTHMPVDAFLFDIDRSSVARELRTLQMLPALVTQDKFDTAQGSGTLFSSEIEGNNSSPDRGLLALRRAITSRLLGKTRIDFE